MNSDFKSTISQLKQIASNDEIYQVFNAQQVEGFSKCILMMESHIEKAMAGDEEKPDEKAVEEVGRTLRYIKRAIVFECIPENVRKFIEGYILLAFNWNKLACSEDISQSVLMCKHLMEYHQSMVETTKVLRMLLQEAKGLLEFRPPAFELSRHYLQTIQEKLKGGDKLDS